MCVSSRNLAIAARWISALLVSTIVSRVSLAVVVDDFVVGPITVVGPDVETQSGLDPNHVLGGSRTMSVGQFGSGSTLDINPTTGLNFSSSGSGYFQQKYTFGSAGQGIDLTQGGQDRFRLRFGDVSNPSFVPIGLYVTLPPTSSSNGVSTYFGNWGGIILEYPFAAFPVSMTAAQSLTLDVARNPPGASIQLKSITTAGPPLAGDYDRNGVVDGADYDVWRRFFGIDTRNGPTFPIASADGNNDGRVNAADYILWRKNFMSGFGASPAGPSAVPEPTGVFLFVSTAAGLFVIRPPRGRRAATGIP
jgi:hypothetical protein